MSKLKEINKGEWLNKSNWPNLVVKKIIGRYKRMPRNWWKNCLNYYNNLFTEKCDLVKFKKYAKTEKKDMEISKKIEVKSTTEIVDIKNHELYIEVKECFYKNIRIFRSMKMEERERTIFLCRIHVTRQ